jgi:hypothetical protein
MTQTLGIIAAILVTLGLLIGVPYYLYKTKQIWWEDMLTWLLVELCLLALALIVLLILRVF